ncbi:hypothetical protein [Nocardia sp. NPDC050406]|uniref:hypothetical protein n=1 Tax=Nocardia sp. NPDC050406 TaxID=3364318 RepID=UPI00379B8354
MRKFAATSALMIAALGVTAATANGAPAEAPAPTAPQPVNVSYYVNEEKGTVSISPDAGSVAVEDGKLKIKDVAGNVMAGTPLEVVIDDFAFPIAAEIKDNIAVLTPQIDEQHAVYKPVSLPFDDKAEFKNEYEREKAAHSRMKDNIALAATFAGLVTTVLGGIVGCVVGGVVGTAVTLPVVLGGGSGPIVGCLLGAAAGASLIGIVGTILITAPVAIAEVVNYFNTINAPFTPPAKK